MQITQITLRKTLEGIANPSKDLRTTKFTNSEEFAFIVQSTRKLQASTPEPLKSDLRYAMMQANCKWLGEVQKQIAICRCMLAKRVNVAASERSNCRSAVNGLTIRH
jgi:hypothetical protein